MVNKSDMIIFPDAFVTLFGYCGVLTQSVQNENETGCSNYTGYVCQILKGLFFSFLHTDERSSASHGSRSLANDLGGSLAPLIGDRKSSVPAHSSQPMLFTFDLPVRHSHSALSNSAPQDYLWLHQCMSRKSESAR